MADAGIGRSEWLTTTEAAQSIGVSAWWVRQRIESGDLAAIALDSGARVIYRIRRTDWIEFCARSTRPAIDRQTD